MGRTRRSRARSFKRFPCKPDSRHPQWSAQSVRLERGRRGGGPFPSAHPEAVGALLVRRAPTPTGYDESAAVVSPNERWISYESNPDNERIYYTARDTLFAADVRADSTFEVLGVEALVPFPYIRGYDVAPDNSGFVVIVREAAEETENVDEAVPPRTYFAVNWFDEIRERVARGN